MLFDSSPLLPVTEFFVSTAATAEAGGASLMDSAKEAPSEATEKDEMSEDSVAIAGVSFSGT